MATIKSLARQMRKLKVEPMKREAVRRQKNLFIEIQQQQLRQGIDSKGEPLSPGYPDGYAHYKSTLSTYHAPLGVPDLYLTGSFARAIRMNLKGMQYTLDSRDGKNTKLTKKYGKQIWGIASFNLVRIRAACNLELRRIIGQKLN